MAKIHTIADVPDELEKAWLQHLRDFDVAHPGCHFKVVSESETKTIQDVLDTLAVDPGLPFQAIFPRKR